jgi:uncharacterized protein (TIGR00725 family)
VSEPVRPPRIGVVGAAQAGADARETARALGRALAEGGAVVFCGGRAGVMEAVARGVAGAGGVSVGILPGADGEGANPWITIPVATGLGEARNAVLVRAVEAVVAVGGGWGTLSEIALAAKMRIPVCTLGEGPLGVSGVCRTHSAEEAAAWALSAARDARKGST